MAPPSDISSVKSKPPFRPKEPSIKILHHQAGNVLGYDKPLPPRPRPSAEPVRPQRPEPSERKAGERFGRHRLPETIKARCDTPPIGSLAPVPIVSVDAEPHTLPTHACPAPPGPEPQREPGLERQREREPESERQPESERKSLRTASASILPRRARLGWVVTSLGAALLVALGIGVVYRAHRVEAAKTDAAAVSPPPAPMPKPKPRPATGGARAPSHRATDRTDDRTTSKGITPQPAATARGESAPAFAADPPKVQQKRLEVKRQEGHDPVSEAPLAGDRALDKPPSEPVEPRTETSRQPVLTSRWH